MTTDPVAVTETAVALALELAADRRFQAFYDRVGEDLEGWLGIVQWVIGVAPAVEEGIARVSADTDDVDFITTIERVCDHILDRSLAPDGDLPSDDALTNVTIWAAHQD